MNGIILTSILLGFIFIILPNIKKYTNNIIDILLKLFFIKITVDSSNNITSESTFNIIAKTSVEDVRIKFFSRGSLVDDERLIKFGEGLHTCYNKFLYFVLYKIEGPYIKNTHQDDTLTGELFEEKKEVDESKCISYSIKKLIFYIPFWSKHKMIEKINTAKIHYDCPIEYAYKSSCGSERFPIKTVESSQYCKDDVEKLMYHIEELANDTKSNNLNKYISVSTKESNKLIYYVAKELNYDVITICDGDSSEIEGLYVDNLIKSCLQETSKNVILFFDCTNTYLHPWYPRLEKSYKLFYEGIYQMYFADKNIVIVIDYDGMKYTNVREKEYLSMLERIIKFGKNNLQRKIFLHEAIRKSKIIEVKINDINDSKP